MTITGNHIRQYREKNNLTQTELAQKLLYANYQRVHEIELLGANPVGKNVLIRIRAAGIVINRKSTVN